MATQGSQLSCKDENLISQHHCFKRQMWWTMLIIPVLGGMETDKSLQLTSQASPASQQASGQ